jgi:outer membrane protein assembly factor BamB
MRRLLGIWRSWSVRRRLVVVGSALAVTIAGVVVIYLVAKRPEDKSCAPNCTLEEGKGKEKKVAKAVNWPVYGYDDARTRFLPAKGLNPPFNPSIWSFQAGVLLEFSPILANNRLYFLDKDAVLYSMSAKRGKIYWKKKIGALSASSPAYSHGKLFAVTLQPGQAVAFDPKKRKVIWRHPLPGRSETSPVVMGNKVFVGCECGSVYALNIKTGKTIWSVPSGGEVKGGVAIDHGTVFFGNYGGEVEAVDASDGHVRWTAATQGGSFLRGGGIYSTPAVAWGRVYAGSLDGRIYSYDEETGDLAWSQSTGAEVYPGPALADTNGSPPTVYVGSADKHVYAFDAKTGRVRWEHPVGGIVIGAASVVGQTVYFAVIGPKIGTFGYDVRSGKKVFYNEEGEYNPVISDGKVLYLTGGSTIRAYRPKEGGKGGGKHHGGGHHKKLGGKKGGGTGK